MTAGGVELATGYVSLTVSTRGAGAAINQMFADAAKASDVHGTEAGTRFAGGVGKGAKRGGGLADYFFSPSLNIAAEKGGAGTGRAFATGITRAITGGVMTSIGASIGSAVTAAAGTKIKQLAPKMFSGIAGGASKAGAAAGTAVASSTTSTASRKINWKNLSKGQKLAVAAVAAGVFFGTRMGKSAEKQAEQSFKPKFSQGGGGLLGKLFTGLKGGAVAAGAAVVGTLGAAVTKGFGRLEAIDDATHKLEGLGHSAKDVTSIMDDSLASVKGTAFGLDEAATIAASAVAAGIKPGKELRTTLKTVADAATIGGASLGEMGAIFNSVASSNKAYNGDLQQLSDRGIPIYQLLAKELKTNAAGVTDLASKGKIGFKVFQKALQDGLGGSALKSGETLRGSLKNAGAALSRFGAGLLKAVFPQLKGVFVDVTQLLDGLTPVAVRVGKALGRGFHELVTTVEGVAPVVGQLGPLFEGVAKIVLSLFGSAATKGVRTYIKNITNLVDFVATHQEDIVRGLKAGANSALDLGQALVDAGVAGLKGIGAMADGVAGFVQSSTDAVGSLIHSAAAIAPLLGPAGIPILRAADNFDKAAKSAKGVADGLHRAGDGARAAAGNLDSALTPSLKKTRDNLNAVADEEIFKAKQRDASAKFAAAVRDIGLQADGSRVHLKKWSDVSKLSEKSQRGLKDRINDAKFALTKSIKVLKDAGAGQGKLTDAWKKGKERLYDEFKQMGLSNKEAKKLAAQYAGIKPKVETKVTQPGMDKARSDTKDLDNKINGLNDKKVKITYSTNAAKLVKSTAANLGYDIGGPARGGVIRAGSDPRPVAGTGAARGGILPGFTPVWKGDDVEFPMASGGIQPLRSGEGIYVSEAMRDPYERARLVGMNKALLRGERASSFRERFEGRATGGLVRRITEQVDTSGLSAPDFGALSGDIGKSLGKAVEAEIGKGVKKQLKKMAGGGDTGKALSYAKAHVGHPYQFGTLWDCSGFISALHSIAKGESPHRRYTTTSFVGGSANGFTRGKRSRFMVGVNPKPGKSGHMAGTINGVNVESAGGVGVRVGKSARGYNNGLFSWRGGLALGGFTKDGVLGDLPFDVVDPRGERYDPLLEQLVKQTGGVRARKYDSGGYLEPGATLAINHTGKRERIRTDEQERALGGQPLVGSLTVLSTGDTRQDVDNVMYRLRVLRRGGRG